MNGGGEFKKIIIQDFARDPWCVCVVVFPVWVCIIKWIGHPAGGHTEVTEAGPPVKCLQNINRLKDMPS